MRYNECNGMEIGRGVAFINKIEKESIFEVSSYVLSNVNADSVQANFDLNILGDIKACKITIMGHFVCLGDCECRELYVQGSCNIKGELNAETVFIGEKLFACNICVDKLEVKNDVTCITLECNESTLCSGSILATEGILGVGAVQSKLAICGEYTTLDKDYKTNVVVMDEIIHKLNSISVNTVDVKEWTNKGNNLEWEVFGDELGKMSNAFPQYKSESAIYNNLLECSNLSKIENLKQYILLFDMLFSKTEIICESDLVKVLKEDLLEKTEENIDTLELPAIDQSDFVNLLRIVVINKNVMKEDVFLYIIEKLYNKVGLKYNAVQMLIGK